MLKSIGCCRTIRKHRQLCRCTQHHLRLIVKPPKAFELFQQAAEYYQKAKTPDVVAASFRLADSFAYAAMTYADQMATQKNLARRLSEIMSAVDETLVRGLPERLALTDELNMETFQAAVDLFDKADQAYEEALQKARSLPARGREAAGNIFQTACWHCMPRCDWPMRLGSMTGR